MEGYQHGPDGQKEEQQNYPMEMPQNAPLPVYGYHMNQLWIPPEQMMQHGGYHYPYRYHYPPQHMEGVPLPPGIPGLGGSTDPLEAVLGPFPCARLRNLPYDTTIEDILALFQGLVVIDVVLVGHGDAFIIFANPMDFQMALQRNRQTIGRRFVDISPASRSDYYEAIANQHLKEQQRGPHRSSGASLVDDVGGRGDEPQPMGDAASVDAFWGTSSPPMQQLSGQPGFGEGLVSRGPTGMVTLSGRGGGPSRGGLHAPLQKRAGGGIQVGDHTGFLRMRGLPFSACKEDIWNFFEGYNPVPDSIVLTYRNDGRATGECYVAFASPEDAKRAMDLHRRTMGSRYIELFISNKDEQGRALARFGTR